MLADMGGVGKVGMAGFGGKRTLALNDGFAYEATFPKEEPACRSHDRDSFFV